MNFHPPENMGGFAKALWTAMRSRSLTQQDVAKAVGVKASTVSRWLHGARPSPQLRAKLEKEFPELAAATQPECSQIEALKKQILEVGKALEAARYQLGIAARIILGMPTPAPTNL